MSDVLAQMPDEDRMWVEVDAALILDEALDLHPLTVDPAGDDEYGRHEQ